MANSTAKKENPQVIPLLVAMFRNPRQLRTSYYEGEIARLRSEKEQKLLEAESKVTVLFSKLLYEINPTALSPQTKDRIHRDALQDLVAGKFKLPSGVDPDNRTLVVALYTVQNPETLPASFKQPTKRRSDNRTKKQIGEKTNQLIEKGAEWFDWFQNINQNYDSAIKEAENLRDNKPRNWRTTLVSALKLNGLLAKRRPVETILAKRVDKAIQDKEMALEKVDEVFGNLFTKFVENLSPEQQDQLKNAIKTHQPYPFNLIAGLNKVKLSPQDRKLLEGLKIRYAKQLETTNQTHEPKIQARAQQRNSYSEQSRFIRDNTKGVSRVIGHAKNIGGLLLSAAARSRPTAEVIQPDKSAERTSTARAR